MSKPKIAHAILQRLPPAALRQADLEIKELKERYGLTGGHLSWANSLEKRQQIQALRVRPV
jgi:hypothetical protein